MHLIAGARLLNFESEQFHIAIFSYGDVTRKQVNRRYRMTYEKYITIYNRKKYLY